MTALNDSRIGRQTNESGLGYCDLLKAPLGAKYCHFERNVSTIRWATSTYGLPMKHAFAKSPSVKVVKYVPDIRDIQVAGNLAYEWGYFEAAQKSSDQQAPESLRAKLLRVMKRQPDGSWKFTRVMWLPD
jgi:hypothetical protein